MLSPSGQGAQSGCDKVILHLFQVRLSRTFLQVFPLSVPAIFWLLMSTRWCKSNPTPALSPRPHPGCAHGAGSASPSSGRGGAPAHCRWSARCPGSTPRGPPCGEHSKATVLADGHCLDLLATLPPPHRPGQQCHEQPPSLPQLCCGPCPSSSPSMQLSLIALGTWMCAWTLFHSWYPTNQLSFGLGVIARVTTLFPEGSPEIFLVPPQPPDATWQCGEGESPWAGAAGVEREGATAQGWGGLGDFGPHPDTTDSAGGLARPPEAKGVP